MTRFCNYKLMRMSEQCEEDAYRIIDFDEEMFYDESSLSDTERFSQRYKEFYDDVKTSKRVSREDW